MEHQENSVLPQLSRKPRKTHLVRLTHEEYQLLKLYRSNVLLAYDFGHDNGSRDGQRMIDNTINTLSRLTSTISAAPVNVSLE